VYSKLGKAGGSVCERSLFHAVASRTIAEGAGAMRFRWWALPFAVLSLAAACGTGGNSPAPGSTMLDATTHDSFFPIAAGTKHALGSDSPAITCNSCHGGSDSFQQFDCLSCHQHSDQTALALGHRGVSQYAYASASCYSCHARGRSGGAVPSGLISDPARDLTINAQIPSYLDTSIARLSPQAETLPMPMDHASTRVDATAFASCGNCHLNGGAFYPGDLHSSLANLNLAQPSACTDCHASSKPTGFVGPTATNPARSPASGEMKHDAVLWSNGLPTPASAVPQDCAVCHVAPSKGMTATWGTNQAGTTPARFHASLTTGDVPQPASCVDCHANSRPSAVLTSANSTMAGGLAFDHTRGLALSDCVSCHVNPSAAATQWTSWSQGKFHLPGSASPATCLPCHAGERPVSTTGWVSTTYQNSPFDYGTNSSGITHGDGQDCATCHRGPGTGVWGVTQNWVGGYFTHGAATISGTTCGACHMSQRPTTVVTPPGGPAFDHSANGTGDCLGCHQATVAAGRYVSYLPLPGGDWQGGIGYPGSTPASSPNQFITVTEVNLNRSGTLITSTSSISATLYNTMLHVSTALPAELNAGPTAAPDYNKCWHCHTSTNGIVASYADGKYHSALSNYSATPGGTITPIPEPTSLCTDCHVQTRPTGIVMKAGSDLRPMDHNAMFAAPVNIGNVSVTGVGGMECAVCHHNPGVSWADGLPAQSPLFHANIGAAVPQDCTSCHYPLMADAPKSDVSSGVNFAMKHASSQLTVQNCQVCHATALSNGAATPVASTLWQTGAFHPSLASQPSACLDCHAISEPAANASTPSSVVYNLALGATSTNTAQWMNHGSSSVAGKDCFACHAADAKTSGSAWSKSDSFHPAVSNPGSCRECHGLTNGGGSVAGTNNNLPAGLTNSSTLTLASADPATGIPAGTHAQITHTDINVSARDCNFCHAQAGVSTVVGVQGAEWAQASFHLKFVPPNPPLVMNGTTGRCSSCHMNIKPGATFTAFDHSSFSAMPGTQDCSSCHSWPGTGTAGPSWLGGTAAPATVTLTNWGYGSPTSNTVTFAHPSASTYTSCAQCHAGSDYSHIIDFNHDGLTSNVTVNGVAAPPTLNLGTSIYDPLANPTFCVACHTSRSPLVIRGVSSTITATTNSGSTIVTTASTSALTQGMTISGNGIPNTTTTLTTFTASITSGSATVTMVSPATISLRAGTAISGTGIPAGATVLTSVNNATSFTLTAAATVTATEILTATIINPLTVTITAITNATSFIISTAANATYPTGTTLNVTHKNINQATIGSHGGSVNGQDCTSCHYVRGRERLTPPTPGVFGTGTISGN
jgi:cytochrome c551/c552